MVYREEDSQDFVWNIHLSAPALINLCFDHQSVKATESAVSIQYHHVRRIIFQ